MCSYMILAPATMQKQADPKDAAAKCLEEVGLDPDSYRIGHTKACLECLSWCQLGMWGRPWGMARPQLGFRNARSG